MSVALWEPDRVLVAGDVHGSLAWLTTLAELAGEHGCGVILQLGDFGYWEHTEKGARWLEAADALLAEAGLRVLFVDGNHENHPMLWERYASGPDGVAAVREHIAYAGRGARWTWHGVRFLAAGGAYSHDQGLRRFAEQRTGRAAWWPEEELTDADVARCASGGPTDVLIAHDSPADVDLRAVFGPPPESMQRKIAAAEARGRTWTYPGQRNRQRLQEVVDATTPLAVWHGHYHRRYTVHLHHTTNGHHPYVVEGLADHRTGDHRSWSAVDLRTLAATMRTPDPILLTALAPQPSR